MVANGALHCGSGCTLGDIPAEWLAFAVPAVAVAFGWQSLFSEKIFAVWIMDYIFAYLFGIGQGIIAAIKAETLSLTPGKSACMDSWPLPTSIFSAP